MLRIIIVGGGASGMMAAIAASRAAVTIGSDVEITIIEKNARLGKKLLSTGNGRCNITNTLCSVECFHGHNIGFTAPALAAFGPEEALSFFDSIGLLCKLTPGGRVYPYCEQASAVLDVFRAEVLRCGISVLDETEAVAVTSGKRGFELSLKSEKRGIERMRCEHLIVAAGGKAAPSTGSSGRGFEILSGLGHKIVELGPALCPLKTETTPGMQGIRIDGAVRLESGSRSSSGEIQFTAYGLTGPAILDVSGEALARSGEVVILDLMPEFAEKQVLEMLIKRRERFKELELEVFLTGFLNKRVGQMLLKAATGRKLSSRAKELDSAELEKLARTIKELRFPVQGHTGWENAQTTAGGADTSEFSPDTMESRIVPGLYATGEVLDVYGDCGGHNLQWAWSSGHAAGVSVIKC